MEYIIPQHLLLKERAIQDFKIVLQSDQYQIIMTILWWSILLFECFFWIVKTQSIIVFKSKFEYQDFFMRAHRGIVLRNELGVPSWFKRIPMVFWYPTCECECSAWWVRAFH